MFLPLTGSWKNDVIAFIIIIYIWETYIKYLIRQYYCYMYILLLNDYSLINTIL